MSVHLKLEIVLLTEFITDESGVPSVVEFPNLVAQIGKNKLDKLFLLKEELCLPYV
jgi:hypothetical protein